MLNPFVVALSTHGTIEILRRDIAVNKATLIELEKANRSIDEIRCPNCRTLTTTSLCSWCGAQVTGAR